MNLIQYISETLQSSVPDAKYSDEVLNELQYCINNFISEIGKNLSTISQEKNKDLVDMADFNLLLEEEKSFNSVNMPLRSSQNEDFRFKFSQNVPLSSKFLLQFAQNSTQMRNMPLYRRNNGHSEFVQNWIVENNKSHVLIAVAGNAVTMRRIFECIKDNSGQQEVNLHCDKQNIQIQALGNSNVSVLFVTLRSSGFECYSCEENLTIGVSLTGIIGFLKQATKGDQLTILFSNGCKECVFVLEDGVRSTVFEMRLKVMEKTALAGSDEMDFSTVWKMSPILLQRLCKDLKSSVSDLSIIVTENGNISFVGSGHYGRIQMACDQGIELLKSSPCFVSFSCAYLSNFAKSALLSSQVTIHLGENLPLLASFEVENNIGNVKYYLAYRVSNVKNPDFI